MRPVVTVLALALGLGGCREAAKRVFATPRAEFRSVDVRGIGIGGGSVDVVIRLHNDNPFALTATGARYRVLVGDSVQVGQGTAAEAVTIPAHDSADARLPLDLSWDALGRAAGGAARGGRVEYRVIGEIDGRTPFGTYPFPVDARGRAKLPRLFR